MPSSATPLIPAHGCLCRPAITITIPALGKGSMIELTGILTCQVLAQAISSSIQEDTVELEADDPKKDSRMKAILQVPSRTQEVVREDSRSVEIVPQVIVTLIAVRASRC